MSEWWEALPTTDPTKPQAPPADSASPPADAAPAAPAAQKNWWDDLPTAPPAAPDNGKARPMPLATREADQDAPGGFTAMGDSTGSPDTTPAPTGGHAAKQFAYGIAPGFAQTVGGIGDIVGKASLPPGALLALSALTRQPVPNAAKSLKEGAEELQSAPAPNTAAERIARRTGEEFGGALVPFGGEAMAGVRTGRNLVDLGLKQLGLSAITGGAAGAAREMVDPNDPKAQANADLLASLTVGFGAPTAFSIGSRTYSSAADLLTSSGREKKVAGALGIKPDTAGKLEAATKDLPDVSGVTYRPAEILNDPDLLSATRASDRMQPGSTNARSTANNEAITRAAAEEMDGATTDAVKPAVQGRVDAVDQFGQRGVDRARRDAEALTTDAQLEGAQRVQDATTGLRTADEAATGLADQVSSTGARVSADAPARARAEIDAASTTARQEASKLFKGVDPDGRAVWQPAHLFEAVDEVSARQGRVGDPKNLPSVVSDGTLTQLKDGATYQDLKQVRSRALSEARQASAAGNNELAANNQLIAKGAEDTLNVVEGIRMAPAEEAAAQRAPLAATGTDGQAVSASNMGSPARSDAGSVRALAETRGPEAPAAAAIAPELGSAGSARPTGRSASQAVGGSDATAARAGSDEAGLATAAGVGERYRSAADFFRQNVVDKFRKGAIGDVLATDARGNARVPESNTLDRIVKPIGTKGAAESAQDFVRAVGDRPAAVSALSDYMIGKFAETANANGKLSPVRMTEFERRYSPVLDQFPELRRQFQNVRGMQTAVDQRLAEASTRLADQKQKALQVAKMAGETGSAAIKAAERGAKRSVDEVQKGAASFWLDSDPSKAVVKVLGSDDAVKSAQQTMRLVRRDKDAVDGVAKATWDHLMSKAISPIEGADVKAGEFAKYIEKNRRPLTIMLGQERMEKAEQLLKAADIVKRSERAALPGSNTTPDAVLIAKIKGGVANTVGTVASRLMTLLGASSAGGVGAVIGGAVGEAAERIAKAKVGKVEQLFHDALNDPEVFRTLTARVTKTNEQAIRRKLGIHLFNQSIRTESSQDAARQ